MNKLVYLSELDSVNTSPSEIEYGLKCLYNEIVFNGNRVVITFNQFTDSKVILHAILDNQHSDSLVKLFKIGAIKVSRYRDGRDTEIRSASQYVQLQIEKCLSNDDEETFLFSALPIKSSDKDFLELIKDALRFSDTTLLSDYIKNQDKNNRAKYEHILVFIKFVLDISKFEDAFNPIKVGGTKFITYLNKILELDYEESFCRKYHLEQVVPLLCLIDSSIEQKYKNSRSTWYEKLMKNKSDDEIRRTAQAIVDICYDYTLEDSINNVAKHNLDENFAQDVQMRLQYKFDVMWRENKHLFLVGDSDSYEQYPDLEVPNWDVAVRTIRDVDIYRHPPEDYNAGLYEQNFKSERRKWLFKKLKAKLLNSFNLIMLVLVAIGVDYALAEIESLVDHVNILLPFKILFALVITTIINAVLSKFIDIPSHSESLTRAFLMVKDSMANTLINKNTGYYNGSRK